ncbi:hypothetical protein CSHISOI_02163 [Colletotrichum shisoi]|uniref:Uncharacterized protein n=1 Tax=Colletotrichum shisoi TaxID=2078593 RepID=A0A5Q4C1Y1_9PEZI|nr:hypothetical protein CSHISOI_02163 [Colletotrichum shisoi]
MIAQWLSNFHPVRVRGLVTLNVSYVAPSGHFDLDEANAQTQEDVRRRHLWHFFAADDAVEIMNRNLESVYAAVFSEAETWVDTFCSPGGMRRLVSEGRTQPTQPFATAEHKADFMGRFSKAGDGGFAAPNCSYKATRTGVQAEADRKIDEEAKTVRVPVLYCGGTRDFVCRPELLQSGIDAGLLSA